MRKLVVSEFVSVDGVFEDPGGSENFKYGGWQISLMGEGARQYKVDELMASDTLLLGRVTYDGFAAAWPTMEGTGEFGERMNSLPKYVVSTTLAEAGLSWNNSHLIKDNVAEEIQKLKQQEGMDILLYGSGTLVQTLMQHDLVDEYRIMIHPIVLGEGRRLFDGADKKLLQLSETKTFPEGIALLVYKPAK